MQPYGITDCRRSFIFFWTDLFGAFGLFRGRNDKDCLGVCHLAFCSNQPFNSVSSQIGSLFMSVPLLAGPIMSNLVDKYGCQRMTMIGGLMGCLGFVLSAVSNSVEILFITFGVVSGLGLGVIYVTVSIAG